MHKCVGLAAHATAGVVVVVLLLLLVVVDTAAAVMVVDDADAVGVVVDVVVHAALRRRSWNSPTNVSRNATEAEQSSAGVTSKTGTVEKHRHGINAALARAFGPSNVAAAASTASGIALQTSIDRATIVSVKLPAEMQVNAGVPPASAAATNPPASASIAANTAA